MSDKKGIDERHEKDRGYDPFKESENDDNRDIISEKEGEEEKSGGDKKNNSIKFSIYCLYNFNF
ncbi:MAG TPA: hypothetical protein VKA26_12690 [Ignavibacteriaceae bacterium]|nr:hypothetical protein [Ignavibacteriaceae bacterium]